MNKGEVPVLSNETKEKLAGLLPSMTSENMGEFTKVGARLGAQIGDEIQKEHPEWVRPASKPDKR
jgi:hypothetical protein